MSANPYNWQSHSPTVQVPREGVAKAAELMRNNGSAVAMGGRGMGKSVFLHQLQAELELDASVRVVLIEAPPAALTVDACLGQLARTLGVAGDPYSSRPLFDEYFARYDAPERLVLLFDEFDRYAEKGAAAQPPGRGFFNDLEASRRSLPQLAIFAAGSIGIFVVRDVLGSSFLARALYLPLRPFLRIDADVLIGPFTADRRPLSDDVLDALFLASGGIPALLTYGLQELWALPREASVDDVTTAYKSFKHDYREYLRDLLSALTDSRLSDAPRRIWERIQEAPGRIGRSQLQAALGPPSGALQLSLDDALYLLEVAGVVRVEGTSDNPITAYPIASLLNLAREPELEGGVQAQFLDDLVWLLARLHRSSVDFFRPAARTAASGEGPRLVPESVFTAHLALGFELLGWRSEREAQRGAGRTDLLLRRNGDAETAVLEVKIWGRNDYREAHRQVESYWTIDVAAGAVVQLTDAELAGWPERYLSECLDPLGVRSETGSLPAGSPIRARFHCQSSTTDGLEVAVDHFLLRLPRRR
jgi:AAA domain